MLGMNDEINPEEKRIPTKSNKDELEDTETVIKQLMTKNVQ